MEYSVSGGTLGLMNFKVEDRFVVDKFDYLKINYLGAGTMKCNEYFIHYFLDGMTDTYIVTSTEELNVVEEARPYLKVVSIRDNNSLVAWKNIENTVKDFQKFIHGAMSGNLDKMYIDAAFEYCRPTDLELRHGAFWKSCIGIKEFEAYAEYSFQKWVAIQLVVKPYVEGEGANWSRITNCDVCGEYFWPKKVSTVTCSNKCRSKKYKENVA